MKKILFLVVALLCVAGSQGVAQEINNDEPIKKLWESQNTYLYKTPTYDGNYVYAIKYKTKELDQSCIFKLDANNGNVIDSIELFDGKKFIIQEIFNGSINDLIYFSAFEYGKGDIGLGENDTLYKLNFSDKTLTKLNMTKYNSEGYGHTSYRIIDISKNNQFLFINEKNLLQQGPKWRGIVFDLQLDTLLYFTDETNIKFNSNEDKYYAFSRTNGLVREYDIKTGNKLRIFDPKFSKMTINHIDYFAGIYDISLSNDDKYLIMKDENWKGDPIDSLYGFTAIFDLESGEMIFKGKIAEYGLPVFFNNNNLLLCWNPTPENLVVYDWKNNFKKAIYSIRVGGKVLIGNKLFGRGYGNIYVYQLDLNILDVESSTQTESTTIKLINNTKSNVILAVTSPGQIIKTIKLIDLKGNIVLEQPVELMYGLNSIELNVNHLSNGIYLLNVSDNNTSETFKILRNF